MSLQSITSKFWRLFDLRSGDGARIGFMAAFLFFLLAANNVIKIVRDSLFLSRFPITQLPYVYLMTGLLAGAAISIYSRYTSKRSLAQVILGSHAFIIANVVVFWFLVTFYDFAWMLYAFYIWSGIVGLVVVAQFWTLANEVFTPRDGKRLFGLLTAAGTLGGMMGGFGAHWAVSFLFGTRHLLWLIVILFAGAFGVVWLALGAQRGIRSRTQKDAGQVEVQAGDAGIVSTLRGSRYLQTIAALIFISVTVSTLIDYQFKAAAKYAYPSTDALAGFFGSYYAWLSGFTLLAQMWLTGRLLMGLGLTASLLLLPLTLLAGSIGVLVWPGLTAATGTRLAEASLRTSVHRSGIEILYLPLPDFIKRKIKIFLDVTVERLGDATAAFLILFYAFFLGGSDIALLSYFSIGLILIWAAVVFVVQGGYMDALRRSLTYREISLDEARIDYTDKATVEAILKLLEEEGEPSVLFGLELAEKLEPKAIVTRVPRSLLGHPSPAVRARAIKLLAMHPDRTTLSQIRQMLQDGDNGVQAEAIRAACAIFKGEAIPVVRPYLESSNPQVKRRIIECLLRNGDGVTHEAALSSLRGMLDDNAAEAEPTRLEAVRLAGELEDPTLARHLRRLVREDPSYRVIDEAMAAAGKRKYPEVINDIILHLGKKATKAAAREALTQYGELAVEKLRETLLDATVPRDIRTNIPRTLSKIPSQSAMDALLTGLQLQDRSIRYKIILGLEEMARRFPTLKVDGHVIEETIISDALLYFRRFAIFFVLFGHQGERSGGDRRSLLSLALTDSMERVRERVMWLLSLLYPHKDIRRAWAGLSSGDPIQRAHAVEFLDNLLAGDIKRHVFPLFGDAPQGQRFKDSLNMLGMSTIDMEYALRMLLEQGDTWLTAATVWEIGLRRLTGFRERILPLLDSEDPVVQEAAGVAVWNAESLAR